MKFSIYIFPILSSLTFAACSSDKKPAPISRPDLPPEVRPVAEAIENEDPAKFAAAVSYPVERPYPLRDVEDSAGMVAYYNKIVDNPLREIVHEAPDSAWHQEGWRGWTLSSDNNLFYIDEGKIYELNYLSKTESDMLDSLRNEEIASLEPSLREDWVPVACVEDSVAGAIFRIDSKKNTEPPLYRLAGYSLQANLSGEPSIILYGTLELEGSMGTRFYRFEDEKGNKAEYAPDVFEDDDSPQLDIEMKGKSKRYKAHPAYWLEHVRMKHKRKMRGH